MPIRITRAVPGRFVGKRFYPNPKSSGSEDALYRVFRKKGYSRSEARRLAKLNAPYFASNPVGRWVEAKGSPIKQIRFRDDGYADVVIVPRQANESIRDLKKELKRVGHPERIRKQVVKTAKGYARSRKLVALEDRARRERKGNPSSYIVYPGNGSPKSFGFLKSAKKWAKEQANASGISSVIYPQGKGKTHHVSPDRKAKNNPTVFYDVVDQTGYPISRSHRVMLDAVRRMKQIRAEDKRSKVPEYRGRKLKVARRIA